MSAIKFIQQVARMKAADFSKIGEGIVTMADRLNFEHIAGEIAATFQNAGLTPDKWDDVIKSKDDVIKYLNIIESSKPTVSKVSNDIIKKGSESAEVIDFKGWNPTVVKGGKEGVENLFQKKSKTLADELAESEGVETFETILPTKPLKEPKYGTLDYDRIAKQEGVDVEEIRGKSFREIIEYLSAVRDKADGGRVGYANGGLNLSGEAQNIYNSWMNAGHTHQEALDYLASRGMYDAGSGGVQNIINTQQSIIPGASGVGGDSRPTGPDSYTQTWTSAGIPAAAKTLPQGELPQELIPLEEKQFMEAFRTEKAPGVPYNEADFPYLGPKQTFTSPGVSADGVTLYDAYTGGVKPVEAQRMYRTPRTIGDQVYAASEIGELGSIPPPKEGILSKVGGMWDKTKDFFSGLGSPKVRGTLGTRLANQPRIPFPAAMASWSFSPFNKGSRNYNPNFVDQLNFLEMQDNMIGRDPNSGLLRYGPESVLAGKNVISLFGTNDYEEALAKEIERLEGLYEKHQAKVGKVKGWDKKRLDDWYDKFLGKAKAESEKARILEEERKKAEEARKAGIAAVQQRVDQRETNINRAAAGNDSPSGASTVNPHSAYGKAQGYTGGNPNPHTATGWSGSSKSSTSKSSKGNNPWGRKDGGPVGLATMFTRRR